MAVWDLFSKRDKPLPDTFQYDEIPEELRNQVVYWWQDNSLDEIRKRLHGPSLDRYLNGYVRIKEIILREHGRQRLIEHGRSPEHDLREFFRTSDETGILLDIVELSARFIVFGKLNEVEEKEARKAIEELNHRFRENAVGYEFNWDANQLVCIKNMAIHQEAVRPALSLLAEPGFKTANQEYLEAHQHFRKDEYRDCLKKCGDAFESTIKIVCDEKGWPCPSNATASQLVKVYMQNSGLPNYFETTLMIIATLRNRLGGHGQGTQPLTVPEHLAKYSLHASASAIVLLVDAVK